MANSGRMTTGSTPRLLQLGLDKIIEHFNRQYLGEGMKLFNSVNCEKGFYEAYELAGMGYATRKGEGDVLSLDSIDGEFDVRYPVFTYEKSARITMEAMEDNLYEDWPSIIGKELVKAQKYNMDFQQAQVLNNSTSTNLMDGVPLLSTAHPLQAGGTNTNRLSPDLDLSEDAVEQMCFLVWQFLNPDGLIGDYETRKLVVPVQLKFVAERIFGSNYRTASTDNDINASKALGVIEDVVMWKRLTSATTWFMTTDRVDACLIHAQKKAIQSKSFNDPYTYDLIITSHCRFRELALDHRGIAGTVGP